MNRIISSQSGRSAVRIDDEFWNRFIELVRGTVIPYQWEALNDSIPEAEPSYAIRNFRIAAGMEEGAFGGMVFQDSDVAKWLEAVGFSLAQHPDAELERTADGVIELIAMAQHEDGYLNTYFTIKAPGERWTNLYEAHELYCAGHMMEAAVAYYYATGKSKLLDVMRKFADHIASVFGPEPDQLRGYDGHQEIELALVKLYEATGEERYMELARFFIDERGAEPNFLVEETKRRDGRSIWTDRKLEPPTLLQLAYNQAHRPVREQDTAVGHAVRAVYMYTAMADLARVTEDRELRDACRRLWNNMTRKQMYITGGIGSTHHGEAFSFDYDLPNDTVYAETCASIGLIFFARRMLLLEAKSEYADVMERALYNNVIGSMSQDGKHYFYVNPLEVWPEASERNPGRHHVKATRQKWFGCSCCPPNVARLLSSLNDYVYTSSAEANTIYAHLFIGGEARFTLAAGEVALQQQSLLPWESDTRFTFTAVPESVFTMALRIPSWCGGSAALRLNGVPMDYETRNGYAIVSRTWSQGDCLEWAPELRAQLTAAHPSIRADAGKAAIERGPLVFCLEETDNGQPLASLSIARDAELQVRFDAELLGGTVVIEADGYADDAAAWQEDAPPYRPMAQQPASRAVRLRAVPYYLWGNRETGEMTVWLRTQ
ncbi:glycoside hydrolase family 127 protein [Paenibacillus rhizovicinus]|uniref:Glycoside hydrolase family 127 protein n=1 Tax=Paenibacillus rhizovicinus TaxID=2704463 RepID=A0A6C0P575_9BACL|nr:beta-L-arabinofuranosidase domain-containing protein [Paenibacillus rhizovicinus]QHW33491.1 glycoside hydrolase family 127 protein [Paenibacillus rhizovicinus]